MRETNPYIEEKNNFGHTWTHGSENGRTPPCQEEFLEATKNKT